MRKLMITTAVVAGMSLSACQVNPQTGQTELSKTGAGILIGAAGGALIDKKKRGRGAIIGAALGGGVGYYMQRQEDQLRAKMKGTSVGVKRNPNSGAIELVMPGNVTFATNSSNINGRFTTTLNDVATSLKEFDKTQLVVKGFTDNVGAASYNKKLSEKRAYSVANYLANNGITPNRIQTRGYGMNNPVASNNSEAGRSANRRVEISILPPKSM